jgi:hypothetical protein
LSYTQVFGGSPIQPAEVAYRAISLTADVELQWPVAGGDTADVVAGIMDVTPDAATWSITMPPADEVSTGQAVLFRNPGSYAFTLLDNDGGTIVSIPAGTAFDVFVTNNATAAGSWATIQRGATTSAANAGALAGLGTKAIGATLGTAHPASTTVADTTLAAENRAGLLTWTGGSGTFTFDAPATLGNDWFVLIANQGTGALTLDAGGADIDGNASIALNPTDSCIVVCDGTAFYTVGRGRSIDFATTMLVKDVSGSGDITLTSAEAGNVIQRYTGTLTGDRNIIVPAATNIYYVSNDTSGAYTLTVKTATGAGVAVTASQRTILQCDGTDILDADTFTPTVPTFFPDGTAGSPGIGFQNETNTGIYRPAAGQLGITTQGVLRALFSSAGLAVTGAVSSTGNATVGGTLAVTGASTLTGNTSVGGTLSATGAATLSDQLTVGKAAKGAVVSVSYGASVTLDFAAGNAFLIGTLTGNITLNNPSNLSAGQGGAIYLQQDGTGGRTLTLGNQFKAIGTFATSANAINVIAFMVFQSGEILAIVNGGFA